MAAAVCNAPAVLPKTGEALYLFENFVRCLGRLIVVRGIHRYFRVIFGGWAMLQEQIPIFIINLDKSVDRLERISQRLEALGLTFERVPAVYGAALTCEEKRKINPPWRFWLNDRSDTELACYMSHLKAIRLVAERQIPRAIVMEDDAIFEADFGVWAKHDSPLPGGADIVKLEGFGAENTIKIPMYSHAGRTVNFAYKTSGGAAAYIITLEGARKALEKLNIVRGHIDDDLFAYWKTGFHVYEVYPFPARQDMIDFTIVHQLDKKKIHPIEWVYILFKKVSRNGLKRIFKLKRLYYTIKYFGVRRFLSHCWQS
jgi:glycosyl transferase family 25